MKGKGTRPDMIGNKYALGNEGGAPAQFDIKEVAEKTKEYINGAYRKDEAVPTVVGLALYLGHHKTWLYEWAVKVKEFGNLVEFVSSLQEKKLLTGSLLSRLNSKIAALMLAKHGYQNELNVKHEVEFVYKEDDDEFVPLA